jgi:xanthine/CO dehydrogenase XdhC/CoxF family maturation factor
VTLPETIPFLGFGWDDLLFMILAGVMVGAALLVVTMKDIIRCGLAMIVMLADEEAMAACAGSADSDTAVVILTHDHGLDYRLTAAALASEALYVGLIGSETKRARFLSRLAKDGVDATRLTCPIGLPGPRGKEPEVIAIATLAQLLMLGAAA